MKAAISGNDKRRAAEGIGPKALSMGKPVGPFGCSAKGHWAVGHPWSARLRPPIKALAKALIVLGGETPNAVREPCMWVAILCGVAARWASWNEEGRRMCVSGKRHDFVMLRLVRGRRFASSIEQSCADCVGNRPAVAPDTLRKHRGGPRLCQSGASKLL